MGCFESFLTMQGKRILDEISSPSQNMETVILERAQNYRLYSKEHPWDDAVT
jgi:hypothetical protein